MARGRSQSKSGVTELVSGNAAVVLLSEKDPIPGLEWPDVLATSDLPVGVINILSGHEFEPSPYLAHHTDVNALSLSGLDPEPTTPAAQDAAVNVKRNSDVTTPDYFADPVRSLDLIRQFVATKTAWPPVGRCIRWLEPQQSRWKRAK